MTMGAPKSPNAAWASQVIQGMKANDYAGNPAGVTPAAGYTWGGKGNSPVAAPQPGPQSGALTQSSTVLSSPGPGAGAADQMYGGKSVTGA